MSPSSYPKRKNLRENLATEAETPKVYLHHQHSCCRKGSLRLHAQDQASANTRVAGYWLPIQPLLKRLMKCSMSTKEVVQNETSRPHHWLVRARTQSADPQQVLMYRLQNVRRNTRPFTPCLRSTSTAIVPNVTNQSRYGY